MVIKQKENSGGINIEKILIVSIPVIGSIIIALFTSGKFSCNSNHSIEIDNQKRISMLKVEAGKANDMIVYGRYEDLSEMMSEGLKPIITREVFNAANDTITLALGNFLKPIDTTYTKTFGNYNLYIKNQYQKGMNINEIIFDENNKIFGIYSSKYPN